MRICTVILPVLFGLTLSIAADEIDLSGTWSFQLDADNKGLDEQWYTDELTDSILLPGSLQEQGYGNRPDFNTPWTSGIGNKLLSDPRFERYVKGKPFQSPFWLTPKRHYTGPAWYQREVYIPPNWNNKQITLLLERPHWQTKVWIDDNFAGTQDSLGTPHRYDLTSRVKPNTKHRITVRVDNSYVVPVGKDAHSISDQTQSNWNGIAGNIALHAGHEMLFDNVQIYPNLKNNCINLTGSIQNPSTQKAECTIRIDVFSTTQPPLQIHRPFETSININAEKTPIEYTVDIGNSWNAWDEYNPTLYTAKIVLESKGKTLAERHIRFGMRELGIEDKQFTINNRKIFLRGTLECCIFPMHGYPPTDATEWKRIIGIAKSYGLNHFRFHSWCPPKAAFDAADELGFYLQVEGSCWATFGDGNEVDEWIYEECDRMLREYGNHPSFLFLSPSNEPHGKNRDAFLTKLVTYLKEKDTRHKYAAGAGWPSIDANEYHIQYNTRLQRWDSLKFDQTPQTWDDYRSFVEELDVPTISHEIGQWCAYPDLNEDAQYTGVLQAGNTAVFRDLLKRSGMLHQAVDFMQASGALQVLLYKQEIEAALRTPGFAGFQLLDLHDFPGQGTAPVGVLNALWQNKGYTNGLAFRRFCNDVVPLLRLKKRLFTNDETIVAKIDIANYSQNDLTGVQIQYCLKFASGRNVLEGTIGPLHIPTGGLTEAEQLKLPLDSIEQASRLNLEVEILETPYVNDWDIWVYTTEFSTETNDDITITQDWGNAQKVLQNGGNVLLVPHAESIACDTLGTFRPVFWNRITFPSQKEHTVGMLCQNNHPALEEFPTGNHSSWQWQSLLDSSKPIVMNDLPRELTPIVQPIDDWNNCQKLGLLFEAKVGTGKLILCSMDIVNELDSRLAARQMRHSLMRYMSSQHFNPEIELTKTEYMSLFQ